jgi:integrase
MAKLNEVRLQDLIKAGKPMVVAVGNGTGLSFRITSTGAGWQLRYVHAGKSRALALGKYPDVTLKDALKRATATRARIDAGIDPIEERRREQQALRSARTVRELVADFKARTFPDLARSTQRHRGHYLDRDILPKIGHMKIDQVDGGHVVDLIEAAAKYSDSAGRKALEITSLIFSHGIATHKAKSNPCAGIRIQAILGAEKAIRPKVSLSEAELRTVLGNIHTLGKRNALFVKILLATCARKSELRLAHPGDVNFEHATWTIPAANSKNRKAFVVPLAPACVQWFRELLDLAGGSEWILPGQSPKFPLSANALNEALGRLKDCPRFTPHDLRRTARTHLSRLGVSWEISERALNHSIGGDLTRRYDLHDFLEERRQALQLWTDLLVRCESPAENVVSLKRA